MQEFAAFSVDYLNHFNLFLIILKFEIQYCLDRTRAVKVLGFLSIF